MTRKQADAAFDSLRRHSCAITAPSGPADALKLLDRAVLTKLQRDAMVHYISVGPDNLALAYSVLKAGAATFATARIATPGTDVQPDQPAPADYLSAERELFAARMIALAETLDGAQPAERGTLLLDSFTRHITAGRERLSTQIPGRPGDPAAGTAGSVGDLLEAAGIAYLIGQLLESPPRPAATPR